MPTKYNPCKYAWAETVEVSDLNRARIFQKFETSLRNTFVL